MAFGAVVAAHVAAGWALLQMDSVRDAVRESAPIFVDFIAPPSPPKVTPPPPAPPPKIPPPPAPKVVQQPRKIIAAPPAPSPAPFEAPPPPPVEVAPTPPAPPAPVAPPAPPAPAPAPPAPPEIVVKKSVDYLVKPTATYPPASQRMRESGVVELRALVNERGIAEQVEYVKRSGYDRLDEAARQAVLAARFTPYTENGVAKKFWSPIIPIIFSLEDR